MTNQEQTAEKQEHLLDEPNGTLQPTAQETAVVTDEPEAVEETARETSDEQLAAAPDSNAESDTEVEATSTSTPDESGATPTVTEVPAESDASATPEAATDAGESGEPASEGASYVPVESEETGGRPRRLKDLAPDMELDGRVTSIALYGIFVDIGVGRDGLVHISEMSDTRIESPSDIVQIGDTVKVRVKSLDPEARRISLTMRSKERPEGRNRGGARKRPDVDSNRLSSLHVGDTVEGTVTGLAPFGAFVDIGVGKDGLVHISELAEGRVERPEDAVKVGDRYTFKLLEVDPEGTRISLSLRKALRGQRMQQLDKGMILDGTVSGLATFGAFVDIGVGRDGLVHISELAEGRVAKVEDAVQVGQKVQVRVLEVDPNSKRISLTMRLEDKPREVPERPERPERSERSERPEQRPERSERQQSQRAERPPREVVVQESEEEEVNGNATLEDLVSKFGGSSSSRRDKKRRQDDDDDEDTGNDRYTRRQRDAIRRTLQQMNDDD